MVGAAPVILNAATNHTRETATALAVPSAVYGHTDAEQRDWFRFAAHHGQTIHFSCAAYALDSPVDPVLTISDAAGHTVARADDERDRDAQLAFIAPADGDYFVTVEDKLFTGSPTHIYRLCLSTEAEVIPLNRPAGAAEITGGKEVAESEPNDTAATAQAIELPADIRGTFDIDWFSFRAEAGHALWLEVCADRESAECDPVLVIYKVTRDAAGAEVSKQVAELDDQPDLPTPPRWQLGSRDPAGRFVPDETATYRVRLFDRFARHTSYRLVIHEATPDFALFVLPVSLANEDKKIFLWQPNLRRGGSASFPVAAVRRGYDGEITLTAEGLPEGVTASGVVPAGAQTGWLVFQAAADAKAWGGFPKITGNGGGVSREVHGLTYRWSVESSDNQRLDSRLCRVAVGVSEEPSPLAVAPAEQKIWEAAVGDSLEIPLKLSRAGQPKGEWQLAPVVLPGLAKFDAVKFDGAAATDLKLPLSFQKKDGNAFTPGIYTFFLRASGIVSYKADEKAAAKDLKDVEFSTPITVKLSEASPPPPAPPAK